MLQTGVDQIIGDFNQLSLTPQCLSALGNVAIWYIFGEYVGLSIKRFLGIVLNVLYFCKLDLCGNLFQIGIPKEEILYVLLKIGLFVFDMNVPFPPSVVVTYILVNYMV